MSDSGFATTGTYSLNTAVGTTDAICYQGVQWASVILPAEASSTSLTFHAAATEDGIYEPCYDNAATPAAITLTVAADRATRLPDTLRGFAWIKAVSNAAEDATFCFQF